MNVEQMKQVLKELLTKTDLTPCVVGHRGVGKSAGILQAVREIGYDYTSLRLGQMEVGDLVGIPYREGETMYWSRPSWWPEAEAPPTVVHCDELNRAQQEDTLQAIFQFVEPPAAEMRRALHTHQLGAQHRVVVSINPPDGSYQVATLDRALLDRMVLLYVETDYRCWADYARRQDFDEEVQQFVAASPGLLARQGEPLNLPIEPTERAWEMVSILRRNCRLPADLEMEVYAGIIGQEAAVAFLQWCQDQRQRPLTAEQVLDHWDDIADRARAQRQDLQAATINLLTLFLESAAELSVAREQNLMSYIGLLERDLRFALVKSLLKLPLIAAILVKDDYDSLVYDAIATISREAS